MCCSTTHASEPSHKRDGSLFLLLLLLLLPVVGRAQQQSPTVLENRLKAAENLIQDLACNNCHSGRAPSQEIRNEAPALSAAGFRYQVGYLFQYLGQPYRLRKHIGATRMPDFGLSIQERLALTLYLMEQKTAPPQLPAFPSLNGPAHARSENDVKKIIVEELQCVSCHTLQGAGGDKAPELMEMGWRLTKDWLYQYSVFPQGYEPQSSMPAFVAPSESKDRFVETIPGGTEKLWAIAAYLDEAGKKESDRLESAYEQAKRANPTITAALGEKIFIALNCAACHQHQSIKSRHNAPALANEGERVQHKWLRSYLAKPMPIRPFGFFPGTGGRMPDFRLSSEEIALLGDYFLSQAPTGTTYKLKLISRFSVEKVETMLRDKFPCLGCHSLRGDGGKIAPDLASVKTRLQPSFVLEMIRAPEKKIANAIMPKTPLTVGEQELIVNYLFQIESPAAGNTYLSLVENPALARGDTTTVAGLYTRYCSPCHGEAGNGDGFNAKYLPVKPAAHGSSLAMESRPDGTLFDGIHSGGAILNKSHRMPAFGETLSRVQIESLVRYIRELCKCEGPAWSRN